MKNLFSPLSIRGIELKNRIAVSPMCQYSAENGFPTDWHLVHLGSRAVGGAALIIQEATAVSPEGRISPQDLGIWSDEHAVAYKTITSFIESQNSIPGIQLAHAGRKASSYPPFLGTGLLTKETGGWQTYGPSAIAFSDNYSQPKEMDKWEISKVINDFKSATERSLKAGYKLIELHFAHGYLVHEFLSPLSNKREDAYGGSFENRCRLAMEITNSVADLLPDEYPLIVRISATDWVEGGWSIEDSIAFAELLKDAGVDLIDCSSGGNVLDAKIPAGPGYQVPFAEAIKKQTGILTGAVGLISEAEQANEIIQSEKADIVLIGREMLRNPYWAIDAEKKLKPDFYLPKQYERAR